MLSSTPYSRSSYSRLPNGAAPQLSTRRISSVRARPSPFLTKVKKIGFSLPQTTGLVLPAPNTGIGCMSNVEVTLACSPCMPCQAPSPSWYIRILPPLKSCFSSAPLLATVSGWTSPSAKSRAVNSSAARYSGSSYLWVRPPSGLRRQPFCRPGQPKYCCTMEKTLPNAQTPRSARVIFLPNSYSSSVLVGAATPAAAVRSLRWNMANANGPSVGNGTE